MKDKKGYCCFICRECNVIKNFDNLILIFNINKWLCLTCMENQKNFGIEFGPIINIDNIYLCKIISDNY